MSLNAFPYLILIGVTHEQCAYPFYLILLNVRNHNPVCKRFITKLYQLQLHFKFDACIILRVFFSLRCLSDIRYNSMFSTTMYRNYVLYIHELLSPANLFHLYMIPSVITVCFPQLCIFTSCFHLLTCPIFI